MAGSGVVLVVYAIVAGYLDLAPWCLRPATPPLDPWLAPIYLAGQSLCS